MDEKVENYALSPPKGRFEVVQEKLEVKLEALKPAKLAVVERSPVEAGSWYKTYSSLEEAKLDIKTKHGYHPVYDKVIDACAFIGGTIESYGAGSAVHGVACRIPLSKGEVGLVKVKKDEGRASIEIEIVDASNDMMKSFARIEDIDARKLSEVSAINVDEVRAYKYQSGMEEMVLECLKSGELWLEVDEGGRRIEIACGARRVKK